VVRVLKIGEPTLSAELCGGTHVSATGEIGLFHIISESSIGAGLRRIEAVTGRGAEGFIERRLSALVEMASKLATEVENTSDKVDELIAELEKERQRRKSAERELERIEAQFLLEDEETVKGVKLLVAEVHSSSIEGMWEMADFIRDKLKSAVVVLGMVYNDKPFFVATITPDLIEKGYNAGKIVKEVAGVTGGGGGGKADFAQAGGKDKKKLDEALKLVKSLV
jgi:alanyl-tRNA synthetase